MNTVTRAGQACVSIALVVLTSSIAWSEPVGDQAPALDLPCPAPFERLLSDDVFRAYSVRVSGLNATPAAPNVAMGQAHLYRTVIEEEAKLGPNFADHYTIIRIGCGAAVTCLAIADSRAGNVYFPPRLQNAAALLVDTGRTNVETLNYRHDSRLLVVIGSPNENEQDAGASYYVWKSNRLRLVRFIPAYKLCGLPESTKF